MKKEGIFKLNGEMRTFDVEPNLTLADALRDRVGLKSLKCGCERGDCGSCTILIDGKSVKSCLILAVEAENHEVTTLEGLMIKGKLTPIQKSALKSNAFQCGYCAPGIIMAATELIRKNPNPHKEEVRESIAGNLCRCTGYTPIVDAIMDYKKFEDDKE